MTSPLLDLLAALYAAALTETRTIIREEVTAALRSLTRPDEYLTYQQAAHIANMKVDTIKKACGKGELKKQGKGRRARVLRRDLDAYLAGGGQDDEAKTAVAARIRALSAPHGSK